MGNIFSGLQVYAGKWKQKSTRSLTEDEQSCFTKIEVQPSQFGLSACFFMANGGQTYIPISQNAKVNDGDIISGKEVLIETLEKDGETDIQRVNIK